MTPLSRNPDTISREIDATIKVRQIREWGNLRAMLAVGYGEMFLFAGLFAFGIGLIVTVIFALPQENPKLYNFMVLWTVGFIGMLIITLEFLIRKFRAVRRALEIQMDRIERLEAAVQDGTGPAARNLDGATSEENN